METRNLYVPPVAQALVLQGREQILTLSNYGDLNAPGTGFDPGVIIIISEDF